MVYVNALDILKGLLPHNTIIIVEAANSPALIGRRSIRLKLLISCFGLSGGVEVMNSSAT